jgi:hypothetical protein
MATDRRKFISPAGKTFAIALSRELDYRVTGNLADVAIIGSVAP